MKKRISLVVVLFIICLIMGSGSGLALVSPVGIPTGTYKIVAQGRAFIPSFCLDYTLDVPFPDTELTEIASEKKGSLVITGGIGADVELSLQEAIDQGLLSVHGTTRSVKRLYRLFQEGKYEWLSSSEINFFRKTWLYLKKDEQESYLESNIYENDWSTIELINNSTEDLTLRVLSNTIIAEKDSDMKYISVEQVTSVDNYTTQLKIQEAIWRENEQARLSGLMQRYEEITEDNELKRADPQTLLELTDLFCGMITAVKLTGDTGTIIHYLDDIYQRLYIYYGSDYQGPAIADLCYGYFYLCYNVYQPGLELFNWPYVSIKEPGLLQEKIIYPLSLFLPYPIPAEIEEWYQEKKQLESKNTPPLPILIRTEGNVVKYPEYILSFIDKLRHIYSDDYKCLILVDKEGMERDFLLRSNQLYQFFTVDYKNNGFLTPYDTDNPEKLSNILASQCLYYQWNDGEDGFVSGP